MVFSDERRVIKTVQKREIYIIYQITFLKISKLFALSLCKILAPPVS